MKIAEVVAQAVELQKSIATQTAHLDELKAFIRAQAKRDTEDGGKVIYRAEAGSAEVVFVKERVKLVKGVNLAAVELDIGTTNFRHLFQTKITVSPNPDFFDSAALLPADVRRKALKAVESEPQEPRVSLK